MTAQCDELVFFDCEATCIGGLLIDIGWAFVDTSTGEIQSASHLVKLPPHWDLDPVWDPDAEKLHGITRQMLQQQGRPPAEIADRINTCLAGCELHSDSPVDDERWLRIIFDEAGLEPAFTIEKINAKVLVADQVAKRARQADRPRAVSVESEHLVSRCHRANQMHVVWSHIGKLQRGTVV